MSVHSGPRMVGLDRGLVRTARAALVSLASVWLAIVCHVAAGGMPPSVTVQLGLLAVVAVGAFALSGRRWTLLRLSTALLGVQALTHVLCSSLAPMAPMPGMHGGLGDLGGERMLALHLIGTAVSVLLLRHGEDVLWSLVERTGLGRARGLVDAVAPLAVRPRLRAPHVVPALRGATLAPRLEIRGPPA